MRNASSVIKQILAAKAKSSSAFDTGRTVSRKDTVVGDSLLVSGTDSALSAARKAVARAKRGESKLVTVSQLRRELSDKISDSCVYDEVPLAQVVRNS